MQLILSRIPDSSAPHAPMHSVSHEGYLWVGVLMQGRNYMITYLVGSQLQRSHQGEKNSSIFLYLKKKKKICNSRRLPFWKKNIMKTQKVKQNIFWLYNTRQYTNFLRNPLLHSHKQSLVHRSFWKNPTRISNLFLFCLCLWRRGFPPEFAYFLVLYN